MTDRRKVFISYHHSDAAALKLLKSKLEQEPLGLRCFLAHHDIAPGEHDLNRIEEEVKNCNALLYVCNKNSSNSVFCQQEIGMAKGLGKKIITVSTDERLPKGFIERIQAIRHKQIDDQFCEKIYWALSKELPLSAKIKKHLDVLGIKGFSRNGEEGAINVIEINEEDSLGFQTSFRLHLNGELVGLAKIGYKNQHYFTKTRATLPKFFTHLDFPFFSYVYTDNNASKAKQHKSLFHLLNHFGVMPQTKKDKVKNQRVFIDSLVKPFVIASL